jgi:uncharacterized protein (TIGR00661 family)
MNIVYGVSGEGLGHVYEALEIVPRLQSEGHRIKVLTYGDRACEALAGFSPLRIAGLPLYFGPRGLSLRQTLLKNRGLPGFYLRHGRRIQAEVAAFEPDVFLTAYEPYTTYLALALKKPLISMDNQNELLHRPPPRAHRGFPYRLACLATRLCTRGASYYIVKSFHKTSVTGGHRIRLVAPLIQAETRRLQPTADGPVLVYLTKPNAGLVEVLRKVDAEFVIYGDHLPRDEGRLRFRTRGPSYLPDLSVCRAIIATTGFSLIADAIHLKKPYFGVPLKGQFEQTQNAHYLRTAGIGDFAEDPDAATLARFLAELPGYRRALAALRFDPAEQAEVLVELLDRLAAAAAPAPAGFRAAYR